MREKRTLILAVLISLFFAFSSIAAAVTYYYDHQNRLIKARYDDGMVEEYTYDQAGNRLTKTLGVVCGSRQYPQYCFKQCKTLDSV
jgi:hypothetical protein